MAKDKDIQLDEQPQLIEKIISINRVSKVTKGMKRLSFSERASLS